MLDPHEPSSEFVNRLEQQVGREVRRRNRIAPPARRWSTSGVLRLIGVGLVSMGIGAAAVASAYQAQDTQRRDQIAAGVEERAALAKQRLAIEMDRLKKALDQVKVGLASQASVLEGQAKVAQAEADLQTLALQLEEVRVTGREPRTDLSAPQVAGRDFVAERLRIATDVAVKALEVERNLMQQAQQRYNVGLVQPLEVDLARVRLLEAQSALEALRGKFEIRSRFRSGAIDASETELRTVEADAELRRKMLVPKVELARKTAESLATKVEIGTAERVDLAEATLRRLELETELSKVELELALVRKQIELRRAGK